MKTDKTLVILTPGFAADETDSTCVPSLQVFVKAFKRLYPDTEVIILAFHYPYRKDYYTLFGAKIYSFNGKNRGKLFKLITWRKVWNKLKELHRLHPDMQLLSFWLDECGFVGENFSRRCHVNHKIWMLGQDAKAGNRFYYRTKPSASSLISVSETMSDRFFENYGIRPQYTVPIGIDISSFEVTEPNRERDIDVVGVGSLTTLKRYHLFVEAIKNLKQIKPDIKAVVCGKGPEHQSLQSLIEKYNLQENVTLKGEVPADQVFKIMQRSKVFLHPSSYEGFSSAVTEAFYAGCEVVSYTQPMHTMPGNFHRFNDEQELNKIMANLFTNTQLVHQPILLNSDEQIAQQIASIFW